MSKRRRPATGLAEAPSSPSAVPGSPDREALDDEFRVLAQRWREETAVFSSAMRKAAHPAYQEIIRMGPAVVPVILRELEREPDHWFVALTEITGANPVRPEHAGDMRRMAQDWLDFGRTHGYL
jgi:hypothetical protein